MVEHLRSSVWRGSCGVVNNSAPQHFCTVKLLRPAHIQHRCLSAVPLSPMPRFRMNKWGSRNRRTGRKLVGELASHYWARVSAAMCRLELWPTTLCEVVMCAIHLYFLSVLLSGGRC